MFKSRVLKLGVACLVFSAGQQALALTKETQYWTTQALSKKVDEKWTALGEFTYRHSVEKNAAATEYFRLGASYKAEGGYSLGLLFEGRKADNPDNNEQRLLGHIAKKYQLDSVDLSLRLRQEIRKFASDSELMYRSRFLGKVDLKNAEFYGFTPFVSDEIYYNTNSVGSRASGVLENRLSLGLGYSLNDFFGFEAGYIDRRVFTPKSKTTGAKEALYHVAFINMKYSF